MPRTIRRGLSSRNCLVIPRSGVFVLTEADRCDPGACAVRLAGEGFTEAQIVVGGQVVAGVHEGAAWAEGDLLCESF